MAQFAYISIMHRKRILMLLLLAMVFTGTAAICSASAASEKETALTNAKKWLARIDNGSYEESWNTAAVMFKKAVNLPQWEQSLSAVRKPFGKMFSRKLLAARHHTSLPGTPDGDYFVIQFTTKFEHKIHAVETLTMAKESDGIWRPAGYFIK